MNLCRNQIKQISTLLYLDCLFIVYLLTCMIEAKFYIILK